jgi:hypothetical protein
VGKINRASLNRGEILVGFGKDTPSSNSRRSWVKICSIAKFVEDESFANFTITKFIEWRNMHFCRAISSDTNVWRTFWLKHLKERIIFHRAWLPPNRYYRLNIAKKHFLKVRMLLLKVIFIYWRNFHYLLLKVPIDYIWNLGSEIVQSLKLYVFLQRSKSSSMCISISWSFLDIKVLVYLTREVGNL